MLIHIIKLEIPHIPSNESNEHWLPARSQGEAFQLDGQLLLHCPGKSFPQQLELDRFALFLQFTFFLKLAPKRRRMKMDMKLLDLFRLENLLVWIAKAKAQMKR